MMTSLFEPHPTARMPDSHANREAHARLKLHWLMSRLRSAVRAFLVTGNTDIPQHHSWGERLLEEMVSQYRCHTIFAHLVDRTRS